MDITTLYVGQGAMATIRHSGEMVVVDTHIPDSEKETLGRIRRKLSRLVKDHKTTGLVLTGFDADHAHADGVDMILSDLEPDWIMYPKYYKDSDSATEVFKVIDRHERRRASTAHRLIRRSVRLDKVDSRMLNGLGQSFEFELFSPHVEDMDSSNNCSVVLKVTGTGTGGFSYLITGDTEVERWERIYEFFKGKLKADVLAAPHHGSKTGVHPKSILDISPHTVLISAGVDNQYGHPDRQAMDVYKKVAEEVWSTHEEGGVSLYTRPEGTGFKTQQTR